MPDFRVLCADHTGFCVTSLDDALPFWIDVLGFELLRKGEIGPGEFLHQVAGISDHGLSFALLKAGAHQVELLEYTGAPRATVTARSEAIGGAHLCLALDKLDTALTAMAPYGWIAVGEPQLLNAGPRAGTRVVYVSNADNIKLELMQPPH
ncbi:MAG: hypothetical protein NVS3B5_07730 [Sphingomicrobium sp.]